MWIGSMACNLCSLNLNTACNLSDPVHNLACNISDPVHNLACNFSDPVHNLACNLSDSVHNLAWNFSDPVHNLACNLSDPVHNLAWTYLAWTLSALKLFWSETYYFGGLFFHFFSNFLSEFDCRSCDQFFELLAKIGIFLKKLSVTSWDIKNIAQK